MSGNDILARVRRAVHMADSLHTGDTALTERLLHAIERCREDHREFLEVLEQLRPGTAAGEQARVHLQQKLSDIDCGEDLLRHMLGKGNAQHSEIHVQTPPDQIQ